MSNERDPIRPFTKDSRLEEIFGRDPAVDDAGPTDPDESRDDRSREDWYRENRPPHHDPN